MNIYNLLITQAKEDGIDKHVVAGIILNDNKEILIMNRKHNDFMGGIAELPSGKIEDSENIYEALVREIKEETNLDMETVISYVNSFDYMSESGKKTRQYNFLVKVKSIDDIKLTEHDSYNWLSIEEVRLNNKITEEVKITLEIHFFNNIL